MRPTFIGIGAQKCASTWLYRILADHPQVAMSAGKELDFFSYHWSRGEAWYLAQFPPRADALACGEISPSYFSDPVVPSRLQQWQPDLKLILSLRDPLERAISQHHHRVRVEQLQGRARRFEEGLASSPDYLDQGRYATHLQRWLAYFPRHQILILLMEEVRSDPLAVAQRLYRFVGVDATFQPPTLHQAVNVSHLERWHWLARWQQRAYAATRRPGRAWLWQLAQQSGLKTLYRHLNRRAPQQQIAPPRAETIALLRAAWRPEMVALEQILERPLPGWMGSDPEKGIRGSNIAYANSGTMHRQS